MFVLPKFNELIIDTKPSCSLYSSIPDQGIFFSGIFRRENPRAFLIS